MFALLLALLLALVVLMAAPNGHFGQQERFAKPKPPTIFVSVASYRDDDCTKTLASMFDQAEDPSRIFVGVCEQNTDDPSEVCASIEKHKQNVRKISIPHTQAKGPTYARYLCSTLYNNEDYFCQIDSHTRFTKNWDTRAIECLKSCRSERPVLTHYPRDMSEYGKDEPGVPSLCKSKFDDNKMLTFEAVILPETKEPKAVPFVSGGFVFTLGKVIKEVPFDPDLPHLFQGEEVLYSARLFTTGYDAFTPTSNLAYHHYGREEKPKFWTDIKEFNDVQMQTLSKVRRLLEFEGQPLKGYSHGMGNVRTLKQYWDFAGVDPHTRVSSSDKKFCV